MHWASQCPFRQAICHDCGKRGHIRASCKSRSTTVRHRQQDSQSHPQAQRPKVQYRHANTNSDQVFQCAGSSTPPMRVELTVNGAVLTMEVDTGASVSLISEHTYRTTWTAAKRPPLQPSDTRLYTYSGELIEVLGAITVTVCYKQQTKQLSLLVVPTDGPALFGRDWLQAIVLDWKQLNRVHNISSRALQYILDLYSDLFKDGMGTLQGTTVKIHMMLDRVFFAPDQCRMHSRTKSPPNSKDYVRRTSSSQFSIQTGPHGSFPCSRTTAPSGFVETSSRRLTKPRFQTSTHYRKWTIY